MRPTPLLIALVFFVSGRVAAAEPVKLSLDEAVLVALRENRSILLKAEDVVKAKAKIGEAKSTLYPTLSFTGGWSYTKGFLQKDFGQTTTQLGARQTLFKSGKNIATIRSNEYAYAAAQALYDKTKLETVLTVRKAFYALLLAQELRQLNKGILENTKEHLVSVEERFAQGQASVSDVLEMKQSLASVQEAYEASLNQVDSSETLLKSLLYLATTVSVQLEGDFLYDPREFAFDDGFLKAMEARPEIRQLEAELKAAQNGVTIVQADARPTISASWDYYSRSHGGVGGIATTSAKNWNDYSVVGVTFSWPLFDGWLAASKVEQARVEIKRAELNKQIGIRDIATEVTNAYLALKDAMAKVKSSDAEVSASAEMRGVVQKQYQEGIASSLDSHDAEVKYRVSLFNKQQAIYDYLIAKHSFEKAMGGL